MICIFILCFRHITNKFNDIRSILKEVIVFPEKDNLQGVSENTADTFVFGF